MNASSSSSVSRRYRIEGMECAGCAAGIQSALMKRPEVTAASVDFLSGTATVEGTIDRQQVVELIQRRGFDASELEATGGAAGVSDRSVEPEDGESGDVPFVDPGEELARVDATLRERARAWKRRAFVGIGLWLPMELLHWFGHAFLHRGGGGATAMLVIDILLLVGATVALVIAGSGFYASAWRAGRHGRASMDTLVAIGVTSAYLLSLGTFIAQRFGELAGSPLWFAEATALLGIIALGHWLEARATARASRATRELLALQPERCERVSADGAIESVLSRSLRRGDRLLVRPGGRVPVDGWIVEGLASIDEQALTGEPLPVPRGVGSAVRAGAIVIDGALTIEASVDGDRTTLVRIAALVQRAQSSQAPVQRLADRIAAIFVPMVLLIALVTLIAWSFAGSWLTGILAATTVLVISCPCALGIATPMAIMVGTGAASRRGMLIKDAATLERAASIDEVVFDKTGTLTTGRPRVTSVEAIPPADQGEVLRLAAAVEAQSEHPIGRAIREAADEAFGALRSPLAAESFVALPGVGVRGVVDGDRIEVLRDAVASCRVLRNGMPIGRVSVADAPRPGAAEAIALLRGRGKRSSAGGVRTIHMLTGDRASGAHAIGAAIGLHESEIVADATPASKAAFVRDLRGRSAGKGGVLLVGDGVNDAAALAEADVGVAMGSGTAIAIEAAPVVLLSEDPRAVPALLAVARASMRCVRQNLFLAFAYNTIAIPAAAFGLLGPRGPLIAAAAMALSNLSVVGNALRLRRQLAAPERP